MGNESRPSMHTAIRHDDGALISDGVYDAIKRSSRTVAHSLVELELKGRNAGRPKTKQLYKQFFHEEWSAAITRLEELQPLLQLCAAHWKSEHVLGASLTAMQASNPRLVGGASDATTSSTIGHKRAATDSNSSAAKKPRQDEVVDKALRNLHKTPTTDPKPTTSTQTTAALGTAKFSRKQAPAPALEPNAYGVPIEVIENLKPRAVDPSCRNLIGQ